MERGKSANVLYFNQLPFELIDEIIVSYCAVKGVALAHGAVGVCSWSFVFQSCDAMLSLETLLNFAWVRTNRLVLVRNDLVVIQS
jgi:hypothetical protein